MITKHAVKHIGLFGFFMFLYSTGFAQKPFTPDAQGYVSDPAFHKLIRQRGYQLVSAFKPVHSDSREMAAKVMLNNQWQYIDASGNTIDPSSFMPVPVTEVGNYGSDITITSYADEGSSSGKDELSIIDINGLKGVLDKKSDKMIIPAEYESVYFMRGGIIRIKKSDKYGLATLTGKIVVSPAYDDIAYFHQNDPGREPLFLVKEGQKYGLITYGGKVLMKPSFDQIEDCPGCRAGLIKVKNSKWGLATREGRLVSRLAYEYILNFNSKGLLSVASRDSSRLLFGILDTLGKEILAPIYTRIQYLTKQNLIRLTYGSQEKPLYGLAGTKGQILLEPKYIYISDFDNKRAVVRLDNKSGLINDLGKMIVSPLYDNLLLSGDHSNFIVGNNNLFGIISDKNKIILPISYKQVYFLSKGRFLCQMPAKWSILNASGQPETVLDYEYIWAARKAFVVSSKGKSGVLDYTGKLVLQLKYDKIFEPGLLDFGFAEFQLDGRRGTADLYGNERLN